MWELLQALRVFKGGPVAAATCRPDSNVQVASAAHDGLLRLWDMRSAVPLAAYDDCSGSKLLAVGWGGDEGGALSIATGGEDAKLRVYGAPAAGEESAQAS